MGQYYYLTPQNEQKGPVEANQLVACGVNANTLVWAQGMSQWVSAGQVQELQNLFAPAAAQQAPPPPSPVAAPQSTPQSVVYVQTNSAGTSQPAMPKPGTNMALAVLTTVLCCLPLGIVAIVYASKVDGLYFAGDYASALSASKNARTWAIIGIVSSIIISGLYLLIYGAAVIAAIKGANY
ncbi:MAG: CD225/dispanin family protein [Bacteroidaceae bacterium]|nr:CD225/dispanin family protein [Bacteroidaceae bacterium]